MIISKNIYISILFLTVFKIHAFDQESSLSFNQINDQHIDYYSNKVKIELERNALHRRAVQVGILAGLGYVTYQLLYGGQTTPSKPVAIMQEPKVDIIPTAPTLISDIEKPIGKETPQLTPLGVNYLNTMGAEKYAKDNLSLIPWAYVWAKENFNTLIQQTAVLALFSGLNSSLGPISKYINVLDGVADRFTAHVFHAGNLAWFLKQHAQLSLLFTTLEYHAAKLENNPIALPQKNIILFDGQVPFKSNQEVLQLTKEEQTYHAQQLQCTWNILVQQSEYVLGFMAYSAAQPTWYSLASLQAQSLQATIKQEFVECAQTLTTTIDILLNDYEVVYKPILFETLQSLHMNVEQDLNAFADLEKLKPY